MTEYACRKLTGDFELTEESVRRLSEKVCYCRLLHNGDGGSPRQTTEFFLGYTDCFLYAVFHAKDEEIVASMREYNDRLYEEDAVELFICPVAPGEYYHEFEFNPNGAVFDGMIANGGKAGYRLYLSPESEVKCLSLRTQDGWMCAAKIPFSGFVTAKNNPPKPLDRWRFNAFRVDAGSEKNLDLSALNPTLSKSFHVPERFVELVFIG